jgi:hypothetical protein
MPQAAAAPGPDLPPPLPGAAPRPEPSQPPPAAAAQPLPQLQVDALSLLQPGQGREQRPQRLAVLLRGLPGSGKSRVAKLIREREVAAGGDPPRILSIDDYFMTVRLGQACVVCVSCVPYARMRGCCACRVVCLRVAVTGDRVAAGLMQPPGSWPGPAVPVYCPCKVVACMC